jgi:hypothetical protein
MLLRLGEKQMRVGDTPIWETDLEEYLWGCVGYKGTGEVVIILNCKRIHNQSDTFKYIQLKRLNWAGHVIRMDTSKENEKLEELNWDGEWRGPEYQTCKWKNIERWMKLLKKTRDHKGRRADGDEYETNMLQTYVPSWIDGSNGFQCVDFLCHKQKWYILSWKLWTQRCCSCLLIVSTSLHKLRISLATVTPECYWTPEDISPKSYWITAANGNTCIANFSHQKLTLIL